MKRREFIALAGAAGAAAALPRVAFSQQATRVRKVIFLSSLTENDPALPTRVVPFEAELQRKGWTGGVNIQIHYRFDSGNPERFSSYAAEITKSPPDVIVAQTVPVLVLAAKYTTIIPIAYWGGSDPVAYGVVSNLARPEGNVTGVLSLLWSMGGKWFDLLMDLVPTTKEVGYLRDPRIVPSLLPYVEAAQAAAKSRGVNLAEVLVTSNAEVNQAIATMAKKENPGLVFQPDNFFIAQRAQFITSAAAYKVPAVGGYEPFTVGGGLASYIADITDNAKKIADYVDAMLRGEKISNLPIDEPTKLDFYLNLKTAKALGITIPASVLARADQIIE